MSRYKDLVGLERAVERSKDMIDELLRTIIIESSEATQEQRIGIFYAGSTTIATILERNILDKDKAIRN